MSVGCGNFETIISLKNWQRINEHLKCKGIVNLMGVKEWIG